jgi:hypothetical protein
MNDYNDFLYKEMTKCRGVTRRTEDSNGNDGAGRSEDKNRASGHIEMRMISEGAGQGPEE